MTISSPNFTRLQDGIKSVDDLRVRGPINVALAWLGGSLVTQLNTHFGNVSNSISAALATFRGTANTWSAAQTINLTTAGTAFTLISTDGGAGTGPGMDFDRQSGTPAPSDIIGSFRFLGRDSGGNVTVYGNVRGVITDPSDASEDSTIQILTQVAGVTTTVLQAGAGVQVGSPTGGDQGVGTLNMDNAIYRDGTQVVNTRVTGYGDPFGALSRATFSTTTVTTAALASFVAAMYTDLKAHGLVGN